MRYLARNLIFSVALLLTVGCTSTIASSTRRPHGNLVLLHFWAPWCFACLPELEELKKLSVVAEREGVTIRTVGVLDDPARIEAIITERHLPFTAEVDRTGEMAARYDIQNLPLTILMWSDGTPASISDPISREDSGRLEGPRSWISEEMIVSLRGARATTRDQ